jgi:hypothetical protein
MLVCTALYTGVLQSDTAAAAAGEDSTTDVEEGFIRSLCSASKWVCTCILMHIITLITPIEKEH